MNAQKYLFLLTFATFGVYAPLVYLRVSESYLILFQYLLMIEFALLVRFIVHQILVLSNYGRQTWHLWRQWKKNPQMLNLRDISHERRVMNDPIAQEYIQQLEQLGFKQLGETQNDLHIHYWYINENNTVRATIRPGNPKHVNVFFVSVFADGFFLETLYQILLNLQAEGLQIRNVIESIPAAYDYHLYQIEIHRNKHGQIMTIETMAQGIKYAHHYYKQYTGLEIQTGLRGCIKLMMLYILAALGYIVGMYAAWIGNDLLSFSMLFVSAYIPTLQRKISEFAVVQRPERKVKT